MPDIIYKCVLCGVLYDVKYEWCMHTCISVHEYMYMNCSSINRIAFNNFLFLLGWQKL